MLYVLSANKYVYNIFPHIRVYSALLLWWMIRIKKKIKMKTFIINYRKCIKLLNTTEVNIHIYNIYIYFLFKKNDNYQLIKKILYKNKIKPLY